MAKRKMTTIWVSVGVVKRIREMKVHRNETYDDVLRRVFDRLEDWTR